MNRILPLAALAAVTGLAAALIRKKAVTDAEENTGLENPIRVVTPKEFEQAGIRITVPTDASAVHWLTIQGSTMIYSLDFFLGEDEYTFRTKRSFRLEDISGMYYIWENEKTVQNSDTRASIQTVDGVAGICLWYRDGHICSLSLKGDANPDKLENIFRSLDDGLKFD